MSSVECKEAPRTLQSSILTARAFYRGKHAGLYEHCLEVLRKAEKVRLVEGSAIRDSARDPKRAELNRRLAEIILYHIVDYEKLACAGIRLPPALLDESVREELKVFCILRDLDRRGAPLGDYVPVLNNDKPAPLAVLPRIVDVAVTHTTAQRTSDIVKHDGNSLFRLYDSAADARISLKNDAKAGERIYAPLAEFFGYPLLAGDILFHSFRVNHPEIYEHVSEKMKDSSLLERLDVTQHIVRDLAKHIRQTMKVLGFSDVSVTPRMKKHEGKIMRKVGRKLIESFEGLVAGRSLSDEEREEQFSNYMKDMLQYFDIASLSDLVALRVVINKLHGVRVDDMGEDAKNMALRLAMSAIKSNLHRLNTLQDVAYKDCKPEFKKTETGYRAYHYDTVPDGALVGRLLRFEVQLKTSDWHNIAEEGGAAHYYYLGGDQRFVSTLSHSYKNLIHLLRNGSNV